MKVISQNRIFYEKTSRGKSLSIHQPYVQCSIGNLPIDGEHQRPLD